MNMDYCKFENTLTDLKQCAKGWDEELSSEYEIEAKQEMIKLMIELIKSEGYAVES